MKDYSFGKEEAKTFILRYEIDGDNMIVYYANNRKDVVPYNNLNEHKVLSKMKDQVYDCEKRFSKIRFEVKTWGVCLIVLLLCQAFIPGSNMIAFLISCVVSAVINLPITKKYNDYCKNRLFLKNDMTLNDHLKKNSNVLLNTKLNTKEFEATISSKDPVFDINTIDKVSYDDLKTMLENIKRSQDMGYVYSTNQEELKEEDKGKVKVLKQFL